MHLTGRSAITACVLSGALALGTSPALAATITLQPDDTVGKDAEISDGANADFNGGALFDLILNWNGNLRSIGLIEFDLSAIPTGSTINSATLSLFHSDNTQFSDVTYNAFRVTSAWAEGTVTFNTAPAFDPVAVSSLTFSGASRVFRDWSVTSVVQGWVSGAFANNGLWIEEIPAAGTGTAFFASSDNLTEDWWPRLTIDFEPAQTAVPEPASLLLFGTGAAGLVLLRRRRRS